MQQQFHRSSRSAFLLLFLKRTSPSVPCSYRQDGKTAKDVNCLVPWQWTALRSSTLLFRDCQGCPDVSALNSVAQHLCWNWQARVFASWLGLKAFESAMSGKRCHLPQTREPRRVHAWGKNPSAHFFLILLWDSAFTKITSYDHGECPSVSCCSRSWVWDWEGKGVVLANSLLVSNKLFRTQVWIQIAGNDNGVGFLSLFMLWRHGVCFSGIHLSGISIE